MNGTRWVIKYALFFSLACFYGSVASQQNAEHLSQEQLEARQNIFERAKKRLEDAARHSAVTWIKVSCADFNIIRFIALTPKDLDRVVRYTHNIQKDRTDLQSLLPALQRTRLKGLLGHSVEPRLAVTLYDAENMRLVSIYMTPGGSLGYINLTPVVFEETSGDVYDWLYKNFASCFENNHDLYEKRQERILQKQTQEGYSP